MAYALGTLTAAANVADTETVTIGGKVYTFQATLTNVDGNVKVGADAATSLANLHAAINLGSGAGTAYAAAMTANPHVKATAVTATTVVVKSKVDGAIGNFIPTTETAVQLSWGAALLASGSGDLAANLRVIAQMVGAGAAVKQELYDLTDPEVDE